MLSVHLILKAAVNIYATKGDIGITSGDKFCAFMEAYCKIPQGAQVGQSNLDFCAAGAVIQSDPAGNRKLNKAKS